MKKTGLFFIIFVISWVSALAQLSVPITEGKNILENKRLELKNKYFKITPEITYAAQEPDKLNITIYLDLYDNKGTKIENKSDWIYLITDLKKLITFFKEQNYLVDRVPKIENLIEESPALEVFQDGKKVHVNDFKSGFNGFRKKSTPIVVDLENIPGSTIVLKFNFVHVVSTTKKKKLFQPEHREWKFRLPIVSSNGHYVDCNKLKSSYTKSLKAIVGNKDITYFESQLTFQNIDVDKLKNELETFKANLVKVAQFKKVISFNQDLKECPEVRSQILNQINRYLTQKEEIGIIEQEIAKSQIDLCDNYTRKYNSRLNKFKSGKNLAYFQNKIKNPKTDLLQLESDFQKFTRTQRELLGLKKKIISDPNSSKCKEIKDKFLQQINRALASNKNIAAIEEWIRNKKAELAKNKELFYESYTQKYKADLKNLVGEFKTFSKELDDIEVELSSRYQENNERIATLFEINSRETKSIDTLEKAKELLVVCTDENIHNLTVVDSIIHNLTQFKADVELEARACESDFTQRDRKQGLIKAKPLLNGFKKLISDIKKKKTEIEKLHEEIKTNNQKISELNNIFNPAKLIQNQYLVQKYDSLFANNLQNLKQVVSDFEVLSNDFKEKRYEKTYFRWVKKKLFKRSKILEDKLNLYRNKQDTLIVSKTIDFKKNHTNVYIDDIYNFNQTEANLKPRLEYLINEIDDSMYRKFPYFYVIIGVVVLLILAFGAKVYINALKIKKQKEEKQRKYESSPSTKITIKESVENNTEKGKGLAEVRKLAGKDYLELDMNYEWDDSAVRKIYFKRDCIIKTYRFFEDSVRSTDTDKTAFETGGYLIGRWDYNPEEKDKFDISLEEFIEPGDDAKFSNYQLNFGAKIGVKLQKALENIKQKTGTDYLMTAWFHSHPGLKIFLSDFDLSVQDGFSNGRKSLKMVALVLDPYTNNWDTGIFTYKADGSGMNNDKDSKRFFSLDEMYRWALKPPAEEVVGFKKYFSIGLNNAYSDTICDSIYFENAFILEMKRFFEDNNHSNGTITPIKYIIGKVISKGFNKSDVLLKTLSNTNEDTVEKEGNKKVGLLYISNASSVDEVMHNNEAQNDETLMALIIDSQKERLVVVPKTSNKEFNKPLEEASASIAEMIEWTRKRK